MIKIFIYLMEYWMFDFRLCIIKFIVNVYLICCFGKVVCILFYYLFNFSSSYINLNLLKFFMFGGL